MIDITGAKGVPIEQVAERLGLDVARHKMRCISREHRDSKPSLSFDNRTNRFKCFGCDLSGDVLDLVQIVMGMNMVDANSWLMGDTVLPHVTPASLVVAGTVPRLGCVPLLESFWDACEVGDWLRPKGLDATKFGIRRVTSAAHALIPSLPVGGLFIPYRQHGRITYGRWRNLGTSGPKSLALPGIDVILYGQDSLAKLDGKRPLYLCEGETDTMSLQSLGRVAIGFPGATQFQLIKRLVCWLHALGELVPLVICAFDDDDAGRGLEKRVREALDGWTVNRLNLHGYNDVNDWYKAEML